MCLNLDCNSWSSTTERQSFVSVTTDFVCWLAAVLDAMTQSSNQVNMNLILQLAKGISRIFWKLLTFFNGTIVSKYWCHRCPFLYISKRIIVSSSTSKINNDVRPSLENSLFPVCRWGKVCPPGRPQYFFCWIWIPKSVSGQRVSKTLCTRATTMFLLLMIRTEVKFPTDEKSWKRIPLRFEKKFGC